MRGSAIAVLQRQLGAILLALGAVALALPGAAPVLARTQAQVLAPDAALAEAIARRSGSDLRPFYQARGNRPLWVDASGRVTPAAKLLLRQLQTAELDGLKPRKLKPQRLENALLRASSGGTSELVRAELTAAKSFVTYVKAMRRARRAPMLYESSALEPVLPSTTAALQSAASARSLEEYIGRMGWMHPLYAPLRRALEDPRYTPLQRQQIYLNLERVRAIPANPGSRYLLIDIASARLWMYRDGRPVDSMRVIVGKPDQQTPLMAGFVRYAIIDPYWNVPVDLARTRIAANVLSKGISYLREGGYQILSDWTDNAAPVNPGSIDWSLVANGAQEIRVRQLPGPKNFMGKVKFMFPNEQGIYLHDTPDKDLLRKEQRQLSSGCVRLEDARRLGRWLLGKQLPGQSPAPEHRVELPQVVPIYITYLTAMPQSGGITFHDDVYAQDRIRLAQGKSVGAR